MNASKGRQKCVQEMIIKMIETTRVFSEMVRNLRFKANTWRFCFRADC